MTTLRSYIDPDEQVPMGPTSFQTERNEHAIRCGACARIAYVDEETFQTVSSALESGLENPFLCEICEEELNNQNSER